jgi:hypothetical protein
MGSDHSRFVGGIPRSVDFRDFCRQALSASRANRRKTRQQAADLIPPKVPTAPGPGRNHVLLRPRQCMDPKVLRSVALPYRSPRPGPAGVPKEFDAQRRGSAAPREVEPPTPAGSQSALKLEAPDTQGRNRG